jgi:hypothetical protein
MCACPSAFAGVTSAKPRFLFRLSAEWQLLTRGIGSR